MENVDEAAENRLMSEGATAADKEEEVEVVVIGDQNEVEVSQPRPLRREREAFLHKMRQRAISNDSPPIIPENSTDTIPCMDVDGRLQVETVDEPQRIYTTGT